MALLEQASELEHLLPALVRLLLTLDPAHPLADLPVAQLRLCTLLQNQPRSMSALGEELGISVSAVTQIADRLERTDLVERVAEADDRRQKSLRLTPHGAAMMRLRRETRTRRAAEALSQMPPEERGAALHALRALLDASRATVPKRRDREEQG